MQNIKKLIYIDMDGVLVDFQSGIDKLPRYTREKYAGRYDEVEHIFRVMTPMDGAIEAFNWLSEHFEVHILSTASWENPTAWSDKLLWVKKWIGDKAHKRLTLTHNKQLSIGDYLIDDRTKNGAGEFKGKLIQFGTESFANWDDVLNYFKSEYKLK